MSDGRHASATAAGGGRAHAPKPAAAPPSAAAPAAVAPSARGAQSPLSAQFAFGDLRAERTRQVVAPAAGALGLGDDVPVHLDGEAAERTAAQGAPALATEGAVYLDPARFDPDSRAGRYLVAHELVHVAQSRLGGSASVDDAEAEADAAARSYVGGAALERPRVPLAPHVRAAGPNDAEARAAPAAPRPIVIEGSRVPEGSIATTYVFAVEHFGREGADRKRLRYVRNVRLHTADDLVVTLQVEGHVDFPLATPDADAKAMIDTPGVSGVVRAWVHAEVHRGPMIDWYGFDFADSGYGKGLSLRDMASQGMRCMQLGLSDRAQVDALLDEVRRRMPPQPKRANQPAPKRRPRPTPPPPEPEKEELKKPEDKQKKKPSLGGMTESEFQQLSRDEKGELAREEILDSIDWSGIGWQLLLGLGLLLLAIGAIIAAVAGLALLAKALVAAVVIAAVIGIIYLLRSEIADIIERIGESDVFGAILKIASVVAVFLAIVIGVYLLVVAVGAALAGGAVALGGLALLALGLLVGGIILKGVLAWHDYEGAKDAPDLPTFHKQTQRAAQGVQGVIADILTTLMAIIGGKMAPSGGGKRAAPPPPDEPIVIEPPQVAPAAPPVPEVPQVAPPAPPVPETPRVAGPTIMEPHVKTPVGPSPGRDPVVDLPPGVKIVKPVKTGPVKAEAKAAPKFPTDEFPASDATWKQWPPPKPASVKPDWDKPGGARYRYDRYRYQKWEENGKPATAPKDLLSPQQYYDRYIAPKAVGQSPGEMGSPEHKALVVRVRDDNGIGTQTMGEQRPDAVGRIDQAIKIPDGPTVTPQKGARVLYEADNFFKDGSQIVSEGRQQVRQFRKDNPDATIVVQDAANPKNVIIYEPGTQPPPPGPLKPGTPNKVPIK